MRIRSLIIALDNPSLDISVVIISFISQQKYAVGAQKNRLNEMVKLCTQKTCEHWRYPPSKVEFCRNILSQYFITKHLVKKVICF